MRTDPKELRDLADFVAQLEQRAGFPTADAFAQAAGVPAENLSKLKGGYRGISGITLLRLIVAAATRIRAEETALALASTTSRADRFRLAAEQLEALAGELRGESPRHPHEHEVLERTG